MASGESYDFGTRAASLLHPLRKDEEANRGSAIPDPTRAPYPLFQTTLPQHSPEMAERPAQNAPSRPSSPSLPHTNQQPPTEYQLTPARQHVRVLPAWVHKVHFDSTDDLSTTSPIPPNAPPEAQVAQHNHTPAGRTKSKHEPGHLWDAQRGWEPLVPSSSMPWSGSRWRVLGDTSIVEHGECLDSVRVDEAWLEANGPDYSEPWLDSGELERRGRRKMLLARQRVWWQRMHHIVLRNPVIPLVIRMVVLTFSLTAMGLGAWILRYSPRSSTMDEASPKMAVSTNCFAVLYTLYITYDEYAGKPLGLRSANAKMRLIFLDLIFIVFGSANLSLALELVAENYGSGDVRCGAFAICGRQEALAGMLFMVLFAWLMTFSISVLRLIERGLRV